MAKKYKITKGKLKLDIFRAVLEIIICSDLDYANNKLKRVDCEKDFFKGTAGSTFDFDNQGWSLIMLKSNVGINEVTHEANHFINYLFLKIGYKPKTKNDEIQSYLLGYVSEKIEKILNKHKKKINA